MKKALFLDRDGVINVDSGYVHKKEDFVFIDGVFEALKYYQDLGYLLIIVTNQSGINRGYYSLDEFFVLCDFVHEEFSKNGVLISKTFYCPHSPDEKCECRKPKPKMILQARDEFDIDLENSIFVGDKISDMEAGFNAGVKKLFLIGEEKNHFYKNINSLADLIEM